MKQVEDVLYGTTEFGGSGDCDSDFGSGCGVVFSFDPATKQEKVVYSFAGGSADGELPYSRLKYEDGFLYGTTYMGGTSDPYCYNSYGSGCGTVFSIDLSTGKETVLYRFQGGSTDGIYPLTAPFLTHTKKPELFGTTVYGGTGSCPYDNQGCGTVFKINLSSGVETVVYSFQNNGMDALWPTNDWTWLNGKLYSTTTEGGAYGYGTIYSINRRTGAEAVIHAFGSGVDGKAPYAGMVEIGNVLYGTTFNGGASGGGTVFSFDPATGTETVLHSFDNNQNDGVGPATDLIHWNGMLYGTTSKGGKYSCGTVFSVDPITGSEAVVYSYTCGNNEPYNNNRLLHANGLLYGTVPEGGNDNFGTIYSLKP
jgi:uncharacterized repeat protein (TIGR03803 family)